MALDLMTEPANAYARADETVRAILNRAFFVRLHVEGEKVVRHELKEPFDVLEAVYQRRQAGTRREEARVGDSQTHNATSPALREEDRTRYEDLTLTDLLDLAFRASVSSKTIMVELRGLEPLTPTLPVWCATSCATAPYRTRASRALTE
jgi:site-specific DNA recombinase